MEFIITLAILGILIVSGVPVFSRMVQKSRKAEAKTLLGDLFAAEMAFYGTIGEFGSNLNVIWKGQEGKTGRYSVGSASTANTCDDFVILPDQLPLKQTVLEHFPDYFNAPKTTIFKRAGVTNSSFCLHRFWTVGGPPWTATASGVIAPGIPIDTSNAAGVDQWEINQLRQISNFHDGIQ
jgi:type II secretory pathway pseudopilin PulG